MGTNVQVKNGTVRNMFDEITPATTTGASPWRYKDSPYTTYQANIIGSGTVGATVTIEVSNDGVNVLATVMGTITLSGTATASDGFTTMAPWKYHRANITAISGTGATVQVWYGV